MAAARVGPHDEEVVGEAVERYRLVCSNAAGSFPVLLRGDAVAADDVIAFPLGELEARCTDLWRC
jgi:hypothetical protein